MNVSLSPSKSRTKSKDESNIDWQNDLSQSYNASTNLYSVSSLSHKRSRSGVDSKIMQPSPITTNPDLLNDAAAGSAVCIYGRTT